MCLQRQGCDKTHKRAWFNYRLLFLAAVVLASPVVVTAQVRVFARGSFTLPVDVTWAKQKMEKGTYDFTVEGTEQPFFTVITEKDGKIKTFVGAKQWVREGKGLESRFLLHVDSGQNYEVIELQIPFENFRVKFSCRHKKKKGPEAPEQVSIPFEWKKK